VILSQTAIYALKATLSLAEAGDNGPIRVEDLSEQLDVPRNYLSKILHSLARSRILDSTRGPGGGFRLKVRAGSLTLADVVRNFDDLPEESGCILGQAVCSDHNPCAAHLRWRSVSLAVTDFLNSTTIADLSRVSGATRSRATG
jgi:Rrf2 family iron-sulfur cluster assembly transcriptional regulator